MFGKRGLSIANHFPELSKPIWPASTESYATLTQASTLGAMTSPAQARPNLDWLILVPTDFERQQLDLPPGVPVQILGFGPLAAAASCALALAPGATKRVPKRVLLIGIAGTFDAAALPVASARAFARVACDGVGVGLGSETLFPSQLGFPQIAGETPVFEELPLHTTAAAQGLLVTTPAASANATEAAARAARFPGAVAEDMEAFGAALACHLVGLELTVIRGISNVAGDRDKSHWQIKAALDAAAKLARTLIEDSRVA